MSGKCILQRYVTGYRLKDDDCLNFFLLYERIVELNSVPREYFANGLILLGLTTVGKGD